MALTAKKIYAILKRQISDMEAKLNSPVRYRGTVATADLLPLNPDIGDMYNIESKSVYGEAGMNVAWNGVVWDTMGAPIDMSLYFTKEEAEAVIQRLVTEYFEKNPVKPGATTEQAQQIEQNKTDIASLKTETSSLKESISTKITKFYASSQGETHLADSDDGKIMDMMLYGKSEQKQYSGKNLLNATLQTITQNGVTCTANGDGTYTLNGTASDLTAFIVLKQTINTYTGKKLIGCPNGGSLNTYVLLIAYYDENHKWLSEQYDTGGGTTIKDSSHIDFQIIIKKGTVCNNLIFKPMIVDAEKYPDATYDDFEPYVGGIPSPNPDYPQEIKSVVNPTVKVCGKNLLNPALFKNDTFTANGVTCKSVTDETGSYFLLDGTADSEIDFWIQGDTVFTYDGSADKLTISVREACPDSYYLCVGRIDRDFRGTKAVTTSSKVFLFYIHVLKGAVINNYRIYVQVEAGDIATDYEPYHEQTVTLPYTLNAIPVSSGGNVIIDGQQYVSDYFDVERGKLVRMVGKFTITKAKVPGDAQWYDAEKSYSYEVGSWDMIPAIKKICISDHLTGYGFNDLYKKGIETGMLAGFEYIVVNISKRFNVCTTIDEFLTWFNESNVIGIFETPTETDLTKEEIAAFKALATYYPTTNISVNSEQLDGYTVFNYPISMANGWNYVKKQLNDNRDYIYDMDVQSAEAYVNSEYAVALTELEV